VKTPKLRNSETPTRQRKLEMGKGKEREKDGGEGDLEGGQKAVLGASRDDGRD
jgi:hypothetical protein